MYNRNIHCIKILSSRYRLYSSLGVYTCIIYCFRRYYANIMYNFGKSCALDDLTQIKYCQHVHSGVQYSGIYEQAGMTMATALLNWKRIGDLLSIFPRSFSFIVFIDFFWFIFCIIFLKYIFINFYWFSDRIIYPLCFVPAV